MREGDARAPAAGGGGTPASRARGGDGVRDAAAKRQRYRRNGTRKANAEAREGKCDWQGVEGEGETRARSASRGDKDGKAGVRERMRERGRRKKKRRRRIPRQGTKREGTTCVVSNRVDSFQNWRGRGSTNIPATTWRGPNGSLGYADLVGRDGNAVWQRRYVQSVSKNILKPGVLSSPALPCPFFAAQRASLASAIYLFRSKECTNRLRENR